MSSTRMPKPSMPSPSELFDITYWVESQRGIGLGKRTGRTRKSSAIDRTVSPLDPKSQARKTAQRSINKGRVRE